MWPNPEETEIRLLPGAVISLFCFWHSVTFDDDGLANGMIAKPFDRTRLETKVRTAKLCLIRGDAIYALDKRGFGVTQIGRMIKRDHTSVIHMLRVARNNV